MSRDKKALKPTRWSGTRTPPDPHLIRYPSECARLESTAAHAQPEPRMAYPSAGSLRARILDSKLRFLHGGLTSRLVKPFPSIFPASPSFNKPKNFTQYADELSRFDKLGIERLYDFTVCQKSSLVSGDGFQPSRKALVG